MSAYALPGLFPPIEGKAASGGGGVGNVDVEGSRNFTGSNCSEDFETSTTALAVPEPLHKQQQDDSARMIEKIVKASVDRFCPLSLNPYAIQAATKPIKYKSDENNDNGPGIAVKEAKIDPVRLVQSVTGSPRVQQMPRKTTRRRSSTERLDAQPGVSLKRSSNTSISDDSTSSTNSCNNSSSSSSGTASACTSPHDDAIEFELSISFNGRKYTATRTMQCILQLRDDLIREMNTRKRWLQIRKAYGNTDNPDNEFVPTSRQGVHFEDSPNTSGIVDDDGGDEDIQIPELPPLAGNDPATRGAGFVGRGFTMLHAMATSYIPTMERWLRNVLAIVPQDSECLTNFLWEPISNGQSQLELKFNTSKSCGSLEPLGSIMELDYNTEDEDSEDEDDWGS